MTQQGETETERIDKIISSNTAFSRKDIKKLISNGRITVNGETVRSADTKIDAGSTVSVDGTVLSLSNYVYLILNKPEGYVSTTEDNGISVLDLVPDEYRHRNLFPAGRLDKDTTGMMIITDDGDFAHRILSPKKHVSKKYNVTLDIPITSEMVSAFEQGIKLSDGITKIAKLEILGEKSGIVTLTEGRYHQIKRMFGCFKAKVVKLQRISMGAFDLPSDLTLGKCRKLSEEELNLIENGVQKI